MKTTTPTSILTALLCCTLLPGCMTFAEFQNNPGVRAAETAAISIGVTLAGQPEFAALAPIAVNGLTALANKSNPTAVTGNVVVDVPLIVSTVSAMIPNSKGKTAAVQIAQAYQQGLAGTGSTSPAAANAVIAVIAGGLDKGIASKLGASNAKSHKNAFMAIFDVKHRRTHRH